MTADGQTPLGMSRRTVTGDERGAILVHAAIAMLTLIAFTALVVDAGALWVARRQAQNSADAAALAGALSLAFDDPDDVARAQEGAKLTGEANVILGATPSIVLGGATPDVRLVPCPPGMPGPPDTCIRADVYRSTARSNALPTFFAQIVNVNSQDVRATATAAVVNGNAAQCMKPWAVADKWGERWEAGAPNSQPWTPASKFDKWKEEGNRWVHDLAVPQEFWDFYQKPTATDPGTGFTPFDANGNPTAEYGLQLTLRDGGAQPSQGGTTRLSPGWFQALMLENPDCNGDTGVNCYRKNIADCNRSVFAIGESIPVLTGSFPIPTQHAVDGPFPGPDTALRDKDPNAYWDEATKSIRNSCAPGICADGRYYARSPRIVPVPLFDVDAYLESQLTNPTPGSNASITITNIMGFFVESATGGEVLGRLVAIPGTTKGTTSVDDTASFMRKVLLVR